MFADIATGLLSTLEPMVLLYILGGVIFGLVLGVLPGLSGITVIVLLMPLCYNMTAESAIPLILAGYSVTYQGGSITAVLLNVPGVASNAATLLDGFPMTQQGKSGRALGITLTASPLGGILGVVILASVIPVIRPVVLAFTSPECLMLVFMGISLIAVLGRGSMRKALMAAGLGLLFSFVGFSSITGMPRYAFGVTYLWDGIRTVTLALGLFAVPTAVSLMTTGGTIAQVSGQVATAVPDIIEGIRDVFRHWWLFLRSSAIGCLIGAIPGVGGEAAVWLAYGHAKQTSKHPEKFGTGCVEGIVAPESANNAKEGGSLLPMLAFGIPGSLGVAILMGALLILGIEPGPLFLQESLDLTFAMIGVVVLANIIGAIITLPAAAKMARIAFAPGHILAPLILVLVSLGAYAIANDMMDVVATFIFGALGYSMEKFGYSRATFFIAYILGVLAERYFHLSLAAYGFMFLLRPIALTLFIITMLSLFSRPLGNVLRRIRSG